MLVELVEGTGELALAAGIHRFGQDCIVIVVIKNHNVLGVTAGGVQESTNLIDEHADENGHRFHKHTMGSDVGIGRDG